MEKCLPLLISAMIATSICLSGSSLASECIPTKPPTTSLPDCKTIKGQLGINQSCALLVDAKKTENLTGLELTPGEHYDVSVPIGQVWCDATIHNYPPKGSDGTFIMNLFAWLKKDRQAKWFSLIAEIKGEKKPYDLGEKSTFAVTGTGELLFYANDAKGFYCNNNGEILVEIRRVK